MALSRFDVNKVAARTLRECTSRLARAEKARGIEYRKAWRSAKESVRSIKPASRAGIRQFMPPLTAAEIARIGTVEDLIPDWLDNFPATLAAYRTERIRAAKARGGRVGGLRGGPGRAAKLTAERRSEIARNAAMARWKKNG
jgi:hypothetical protein